MFSNSFLQDIIRFKSVSLVIRNINFLSTFICIYLTLITPKGLNKISITFLGLINSISGLTISKVDSSLENRLNDLQITSRISSKNLLEEYLKESKNITIEVTKTPMEERNIVDDVVSFWIQQDKHLLVVASTGDGKSTSIKLFTTRLLRENYSISARDIDATFDDYSHDINVTFDLENIEKEINKDLEELESRIILRRTESRNFNPIPKFIVTEELPALNDELDNIPIWIKRMSNRGRKAKLFLCIASQNDTVDSLGLKGNSKLINNFVKLYLGSKALERAKQLKDDVLIEWLQGTRYGRGLIDDNPCLINISSLSTTSLPTTDTELIQTSISLKSADKSEITASEVDIVDAQNDGNSRSLGDKSEQELIDIGKILKSDGYSKTKIIKLLFGIDGGVRFTELSKKLDTE